MHGQPCLELISNSAANPGKKCAQLDNSHSSHELMLLITHPVAETFYLDDCSALMFLS